ncbi:MAG TPA: MarR family transcriptional regulator, partial [Ktedonobacterales bacterium]|nr:MarR family transcriptional regulator [Ktedonobacterales bacterium]
MTPDERPNREDVERLVTALFQVNAGLERGKQRNAQASALTLLQVVAFMPGASPTELATAVSLHQSSITRQVSLLEEAGYVTVTVNPRDRRSCKVTLTEAGHAELTRLFEIGMSRFATFVADWDAEEVRTFTHLLMKFEASKTE